MIIPFYSKKEEFGCGEPADVENKVVMASRRHTTDVVINFQSFSLALSLSNFLEAQSKLELLLAILMSYLLNMFLFLMPKSRWI